MKTFFTTIPKHITQLFVGYNLLGQGIMIASTAIIVLSGFDWWYYQQMYTLGKTPFFFLAVIIGLWVPIVLSLTLLIVGYIQKKKELVITGWATGQAIIISEILTAIYKAFTGRIQPPHDLSVDISHQFQFGFLRHGAFWGWPSSHTAAAFAMSFALITLYPQSKIIRYGSFIYALYIGIGVSANIHWFSEFVAGTILGAIIGKTVGKGFQKINL